VAFHTDRSFAPVLRRAAGLVIATGEPDAHGRLLALEMGLPAVIAVGEAYQALQDGMHIVMDAKRGVVYERPPGLVRAG
jgi:phosphohistidine swiveling domain-containing protein